MKKLSEPKKFEWEGTVFQCRNCEMKFELTGEDASRIKSRDGYSYREEDGGWLKGTRRFRDVYNILYVICQNCNSETVLGKEFVKTEEYDDVGFA